MTLPAGDMPLDRQCRIIAHQATGGANIWGFEKASGILTHPNKEKDSSRRKANTLLHAPYDEKEESYYWTDSQGIGRKLCLVHRLDSPTSGVILGVDSPELSSSIKQAFSKRLVSKTYHAIVLPSKAPLREGTWKDNLLEKREKGKLRVVRGNGPTALTRASVERSRIGLYGLSLLKLMPQTGRTHQLRIQCALRNVPILGDKNYGNFALNRKLAKASKIDRLCLHASRIELEINWKGRAIVFSADSPLPRSFGKLLS